MKFEDMTQEAQEVAKLMIERAIEHGQCMGMDEGLDDNGKPQHFRHELESFVGFKN